MDGKKKSYVVKYIAVLQSRGGSDIFFKKKTSEMSLVWFSL